MVHCCTHWLVPTTVPTTMPTIVPTVVPTAWCITMAVPVALLLCMLTAVPTAWRSTMAVPVALLLIVLTAVPTAWRSTVAMPVSSPGAVVWLWDIYTISLLQLATVGNDDLAFRLVSWGSLGVLNCGYNVHSLHNLSEHHMFAIQMRGWHCGNEELRPIGAWAETNSMC